MGQGVDEGKNGGDWSHFLQMFSALSPTCSLFPRPGCRAWGWLPRAVCSILCFPEDHCFHPRAASLCEEVSTFELAHCTQAVCVPQTQCASVAELIFCDWRLPCIFGHSGHWRVNWGFSSVQLLSPIFGVVFYWLVSLRGLDIKRRQKPSCMFP